MQRATNKTYLSKKILDKYAKEKEKKMQKALGIIQEEGAVVDESGIQQEEKKEPVKLDASMDSDEDELSGEELSEDELGGDDISQVPVQRQQLQQQQMFNPQNSMPMQQQYIQPQQMFQQQMFNPQNSMPMQQQQIQPQQMQFQQQMLQPQQQMFQPQQQMQQMIQPQNQRSQLKKQNQSSTNSRHQIQQVAQPQKQGIMQSISQGVKNIFGGRQPQQQMQQQPQQQVMLQPFPQMQDQQFQQQPQGKKQKIKAEVDTNVFQISMSCLKEGSQIQSGDPTKCSSCQAVLNKFSKIENVEGKQVWPCEFCNHKNDVCLDDEEIPKEEAVTYILEAAPIKEETKTAETQDDISIVFCIDISGSMNAIKGGSLSRLQCVIQTICSQITEMKTRYPKRKLGLVTFTDKIEVIGDATTPSTIIDATKLNDYDFIKKTGIACASSQMSKPIEITSETLFQKVAQLLPQGSTALGPGLLASVAMAGEGSTGSQVIVCTDGASNVGLGMTNGRSAQQLEEQKVFYDRVGEYAQTKGVSCHIVTIIGAECNIDAITGVAEMTGGEIERVDPQDLNKNFKEFVAKPALASQVVLKVKLHKGMELRNEDAANLSHDKTILIKKFGNVTEDTEMTFEYKMKSVKQLLAMEDIDLTTITSFPFQAQITYTAQDGSKGVRVITSKMEISSDRKEVEKDANFEILGINAVQQSAKLAKLGNLKKAQVQAKAWDNHMMMNCNNTAQTEQFNNYRSNVNGIYSAINQQLSYQPQQQQQMSSKMQMAMPQQRMQYSDNMSQQLYAQSRVNKSKFNKK